MAMSMNYAFVTGASRGIGREVALELARKGYFVFLAGRDSASLEDTSKSISESGGNAEVIKLDLLSLEDIRSATSVIKEKTNHLAILANIAGMYHDERRHFFNISFEKYPDEAIIKNINAILVGHVLLTKYLVPLMDDASSIVNMSGAFDKGETGVISDFITKQAIEIFTKQLALELKEKGVRVNGIRPGFVYTENVQKFFPEIKPEEALDPVLVAKKIIEIAEDKKLNGGIVEIKK